MITRKENKHKPHEQIGNICGLMKEYRLPEGEVSMPVEDTPAVIAIMLYLLDNDTNRTATKLQYQMHLLDNMCLFEGTSEHILDWSRGDCTINCVKEKRIGGQINGTVSTEKNAD